MGAAATKMALEQELQNDCSTLDYIMERETNEDRETRQGDSNTGKRLHDNSIQNKQDFTPAKRRFCSKSISSRVTDWLEQIPAEASGTAFTFPNHDITSLDVGPFDRAAMSQAPSSDPDLESAGDLDRTETATVSTRKPRLVEKDDYRDLNLESNHIKFYFPEEMEPAIPSWAEATCKIVLHLQGPQKVLSKRAWYLLLKIHRNVAVKEAEVSDWLETYLCPTREEIPELGLALQKRVAFKRSCVLGGNAPNPVSVPQPDLIYGYTLEKEDTEFTEAQMIAGKGMDPPMGQVNSNDLAFPFLLIECKAEGTSTGGLVVAENQCIGGSATCVQFINKLNDLLPKQYQTQRKVRNTVFSIAFSQNYARLYVTWMADDGNYCVRSISEFLLRTHNECIRLSSYIKNIVEWGRGDRLEEIRQALEVISEKDRKYISERAKARKPIPDTPSRSSKRRRSMTE
ncbi:hypothetical protein PG996_012647 [Apiospora saccharicola]|uniref:DUF7924 domain-containing protein n=1 Tax=Apiospora saccharicola TaxID=335842 RepID=A0ABR1U5A2_9PEZI